MIARDRDRLTAVRTARAAAAQDYFRSHAAQWDRIRKLHVSQPRISRHLKLLVEAGLVERFREGAWAFFRLAEGGGSRRVRARR